VTKLPVVSGREVVRADERRLTVIVPLHRGALPRGTLGSILRQAGMTADDLRQLL
jgi:predicted RNA binding protein YcfA (HicA-like mRNA interferase family)